jgi:MFS family permease
MTDRPSALSEWKLSWRVVAASMVGLSLGGLTPYSIGAFVQPLEAEFGWSRTWISSGMTVALFMGAVLTPVVGLLIDRIGPRRIAIPGVICLCAAIAMLSMLGTSLWVWFGLWILVGLSQVMIKTTVWLTGVSSAFDRSRGLAIGLGLSGGTLASAIAPLLSTFYIDEFGWRTAYVCLAASWGVVVIPVVILWFRSPRDQAVRKESRIDRESLPGVDLREGLRSPAFIKIMLSALAIITATMALSVMMIPVLESQGIDKVAAARVAALMGLSSIFGRVATGYLLDKLDARLVGAISFMFPVAACVMLLALPGSVPAAILAALLLGLCLGGEYDCTAYLSSRHFGLRRFGTLYGLVVAAMAGGIAIAPLWISYIYDVTKSYRLGIMICIPMALLAAGMLLSLAPNPRFGKRDEAERQS